jgi:hypothetical protein
MVMSENGFEGEYLGGHPKLTTKDHRYIRLQLDAENLAVYHNDYPWIELLLLIPYAEIFGVQSLPRERISALRFLALGPAVGLLWRKKESFLTLTLKDELDMEQTAFFKMNKPEEALKAVYGRVVEAKKRLSK